MLFYNIIMKRVFLLLLFLLFFQSSVFSAPKKMVPETSGGELKLQNIFIYAIPDDNKPIIEQEEKDAPEDAYINPAQLNKKEEEIVLEQEPADDNVVLNATTLKGYTQYIEDSNIIHLKDDNNEFVLNIKTPQKIISTKSLNFGVPTAKPTLKYVNEEYLIAPNTISASSRIGNLTIGAQYNNEIDNIAMLEAETGLFTKYEKNKFALSSSVTKSLNTTYAQDYNTISIAPELKLNNYMSLKNVLSADITRNRRSSKLIFSINPFGKKDGRMFFEFGAKQTYNIETEATSTQFSFSTQFKL